MNEFLDKLFSFNNKDESVFAGISFIFAVNVLFLLLTLLTHLTAFILDFTSVGFMYFLWLMYNLSILSKQFYIITVSKLIKKPILKMDVGALFASIALCVVVFLLCNYKFDLLPVNNDSRGTVLMGQLFVAAMFIHAPILNGRSICEIGFTSNKLEADKKTFYIEKKKFLKIRAVLYILPMITIMTISHFFLL